MDDVLPGTVPLILAVLLYVRKEHAAVADLIVETTMRHRLQLMFTGFLQVMLVSMNTIYVTHQAWVLLTLTSFGISFLWSGNVRRVAFGDTLDRVMYATGAAIGCAIGVVISAGLTR